MLALKRFCLIVTPWRFRRYLIFTGENTRLFLARRGYCIIRARVNCIQTPSTGASCTVLRFSRFKDHSSSMVVVYERDYIATIRTVRVYKDERVIASSVPVNWFRCSRFRKCSCKFNLLRWNDGATHVENFLFQIATFSQFCLYFSITQAKRNNKFILNHFYPVIRVQKESDVLL